LTSPQDISENFGESHHCKDLKFVNFGESGTLLGRVARISGSQSVRKCTLYFIVWYCSNLFF